MTFIATVLRFSIHIVLVKKPIRCFLLCFSQVVCVCAVKKYNGKHGSAIFCTPFSQACNQHRLLRYCLLNFIEKLDKNVHF